jgi:predicted nucleic acid-binding protein
VRSLLAPQGDAAEWVRALDAGEAVGHAPGHVDVEVAHAFLRYCRGGIVTQVEGAAALSLALDVPLVRHDLTAIVGAAFGVSLRFGLSAYDACYWTLAASLDAPLVTADRRLAASYGRSILIA